ncbi:MCP four helix bundle domain-containing protein [Novosphingobium profundi]|uniref:methyl-accepting chemotaxis protein n=1 Tax=Novosphingobium profundi TaxID=1774954 RepID=UPI001BDA9750|nr:methyl-accepting chemotaxis protein [Novosphingobium profundi]MBT0671733.1 MCP four helix bundle domain-containing protein [Novosphingobium profundi]
MAFINNLRLPWKLWAAFSFIGLILGVVAYDDYSSTGQLGSIVERQHTKGFEGMSALTETISSIKQMRIQVYSYTTSLDSEEREMVDGLNKKNDATLDAALSAFKQLGLEELDPQYDALVSQIKITQEHNSQAMALVDQGRASEALNLIKDQGRIDSRAAIAEANKLIDALREQSTHSSEEAQAKAASSKLVALFLAIFGIGMNVAVWLFLNQNVARPLGQIVQTTTALAEGKHVDVPFRDREDEVGEIAGALEHFRSAAEERSAKDAAVAAEQQTVTNALRSSLQAIKEGDLTRTIETDFPPAYTELKTNYNGALASLRELIGAVTESAQAIRTGSHEIAQASEDLARRTESNAASLEETSAAITQMDERLHATAEAAGRTVQRADGAMSVVNSGRSIADDAVSAMGRVSESAKGIDSVIEGLDKIAFQTRVLAMNAAVEAGRAGDAGRGFAVVADLVSALAMRSEEEAKRAREQLTATQADIGTAVEAVQRVDGALQNISGDVSEVHTLLSEIASDNQAQSSTISQISSAIGTMDQATQQNAAMVEETSAAARNLNSEVSGLSERAATFRIGTGSLASHTPRVAAPRPAVAARPAPARAPAAPSAPAPMAAPQPGFAASDDDWVDF